MSDNTKIEWTDATANYLNGCSVISAGCTNCYAMRLAGTRLRDHPSRAGLTMQTKAGPVWTGETRANDRVLQDVLGWKRPRRIFWNAHGDLFHESVPDAVIDRQFAVMALTPQHQHQVLTKRPERMREYLSNSATPERIASVMFENYKAWQVRMFPTLLDALDNRANEDDPSIAAMPLPNVWLGTSVEDQRAADERIPHLLATPAAVRFLSCEPLLGPVDLTELPAIGDRPLQRFDALRGVNRLGPAYSLEEHPSIDWVIAGGESGPGARPIDEAWARSLRDQCHAAGVAFFMKQMSGARKPLPPIPDDLLIREMPNA
jgi:protein gp37